MKKTLPLVAIAVLLVMLVPLPSYARKTSGVQVTTLFAGQHIDVGTLSVWNDANTLYVQYDTVGWTMSETHLYVDSEPPDTSAPGQFPYKHEGLGDVNTDLYEIPLNGWVPGTVLYVAAHADVCAEGQGVPPLGAESAIQVIIAEVTLWAGQHIDAGIVTIAVEGDNLVVTYATHSGWVMNATHLYVGAEPPGESAPGQFPYKHEDLGGVTEDVYVIPLQEIGVGCDDTVYLAAHAELYHPEHGEETGWGEGDEFGHGWAMYFWATITCPPPPPPPPQCETAWAWGPYELPGGSWGWYFDYTVQGMRLRGPGTGISR
jgi:hypothetical protein